LQRRPIRDRKCRPGKNTVVSNALAAAAQGKDVSINWFDTDKKTPFARIYWFVVNY